MTEMVVRWPAAPGQVIPTGSWDVNIGKLIPVRTGGISQYGQVLSVRYPLNQRFVDLTVRLIQGELGFGPDDECEGADAE